MSRYISDGLRNSVTERAKNRCEYCLLPYLPPMPKHQIEHVLAIQHGGETVSENLALACISGNCYKGPNLSSFDFETNQIVRLFNPRKDSWTEHFQVENGEIIPLTAEGRVTVRLLRFNDEDCINERLELIEAGFY